MKFGYALISASIRDDLKNRITTSVLQSRLWRSRSERRQSPRSVSSTTLGFRGRSEWLVRRTAPQHPIWKVNGSKGPEAAIPA